MPDLIPSDFTSLAKRWCEDQSSILLLAVWRGYELLRTELPAGIDPKDLERSITESFERRIRRVLTGDEPFDIQHNSYERETMMAPPAQPPQYDLAFVYREAEQIKWPLEAKVLETDGAIGEYVNEIKDEFLTCRYAPFTGEGAMLAYLLSGEPKNVFQRIAQRIPCSLTPHPTFLDRPHMTSEHKRILVPNKPYPREFRCHHLILQFPGFTRGS